MAKIAHKRKEVETKPKVDLSTKTCYRCEKVKSQYKTRALFARIGKRRLCCHNCVGGEVTNGK